MTKRRKVKLSYTEKAGTGFRATVRDERQKSGRWRGQVRETREQANQDALAHLQSQQGPSPEVTLAEAVERVMRDTDRRERRPGTVEFYQMHARAMVTHFGATKRLAKVGVHDVQGWIDKRRPDASPTTIRHGLQVLKRCLLLCGMTAPWKDLILPRKVPVPATDRLTWAEALAAVHNTPEPWRSILCLVLGTGVRRTELARMGREHLDPEGRRIIVPVGKTNPRVLPMPDRAAMTIVRVLGANATAWVIPGGRERERIDWLCQNTIKARAMSGQPKLGLHALRHAFASRIKQQFPIEIVSALLGHALPGTTGLYVHADQQALLRAMEFVWSDL